MTFHHGGLKSDNHFQKPVLILRVQAEVSSPPFWSIVDSRPSILKQWLGEAASR